MRAVEPLLYEHKVALVVTGHVHGESAPDHQPFISWGLERVWHGGTGRESCVVRTVVYAVIFLRLSPYLRSS